MKRKLFAILLTLVFVLSLSMTSLAATWDNVDSLTKLEQAFQDTDADVIINLTGDIECLRDFSVNENQTYKINGEEYTLAAIWFYGKGNVVLNTQLKDGSSGETALEAYEEVNVTVNGDVEGSVDVGDSAEVTINGDINAVDGTAPDEDGNLDVGDMNTPGSYSDAADSALNAYGDAKVTVNGNVTGGDAYGSYAYASTGIEAYGNATVVVSGNVTGGNVTANPEVKSDDMPSRAGSGISMSSTATVQVGGDVKGGSTNGQDGEAGEGAIIYLQTAEEGKSQGQLIVKGDIIGGDATAKGGENASGLMAKIFDGPLEMTLEDVDDNGYFTHFAVYEAVNNIDWFGNQLNMEYDEIENYVAEYAEAVEEVYLNTTGTALPTTSQGDTWDAILNTVEGLGADEQADFKEAILQCYNDVMKKMTPKDFSEYLPEVEVYSVQGGNGADAVSGDVEDLVTQLVEESLDYTIKVTQAANGTVSVDKEAAKTGEKVVVTATPASGYQVSKVLVNGKAIQAVGGEYSFTVVEGGAIEVTAEFAEASSVPTSPKTGDASQAVLYLMIAVLSLGAVVVTGKKMAR